MQKEGLIIQDFKSEEIQKTVLQSIGLRNVSIIKFLMAENLKQLIDKFIMDSKPEEKIPDKMYELFDLANHISSTTRVVQRVRGVIDLKNIV